jgi:hypothetical protein
MRIGPRNWSSSQRNERIDIALVFGCSENSEARLCSETHFYVPAFSNVSVTKKYMLRLSFFTLFVAAHTFRFTLVKLIISREIPALRMNLFPSFSINFVYIIFEQ